MYNFNEISSLSELKELCFYIKAFNECGVTSIDGNNASHVTDYLKNQYNLEISVSKLYLFAKKIAVITGNEKLLPKENKVKDIINAYIANVREQFSEAEIEVIKAELNFNDPKHKTGKETFKSSSELSSDISLKKSMHSKLNSALLIWAMVVGVFLVSLTYCVLGIFVPSALDVFVAKFQEVVILVASILILTCLTYVVLYLINHSQLKTLNNQIENYYKYQNIIKKDLQQLTESKQKLFALKNQFSINGIELTDSMMFNFLNNTDELDIKYFGALEQEKKKSVPAPKIKKNNISAFSQVLSRHEQNQQWMASEWAKIEKQNMNREIIARVNALAEFIKTKGLEDVTLAQKISNLYCEELSVVSRKQKIDEADSKITLAKNYVQIVDKISEFENLNFFDKAKLTTSTKPVLMVSKVERLAFSESLNITFNRIAKANALGLLSSGHAKTYLKLQQDIEQGVIQGVEVNSVSFRYDLAKLFIRLFEELSTYDILN